MGRVERGKKEVARFPVDGGILHHPHGMAGGDNFTVSVHADNLLRPSPSSFFTL